MTTTTKTPLAADAIRVTLNDETDFHNLEQIIRNVQLVEGLDASDASTRRTYHITPCGSGLYVHEHAQVLVPADPVLARDGASEDRHEQVLIGRQYFSPEMIQSLSRNRQYVR